MTVKGEAAVRRALVSICCPAGRRTSGESLPGFLARRGHDRKGIRLQDLRSLELHDEGGSRPPRKGLGKRPLRRRTLRRMRAPRSSGPPARRSFAPTRRGPDGGSSRVSTGRGRLTTWYAHMRRVDMHTGETVTAGQRIGQVGDLGNAPGCHLHFEIHPSGGSLDRTTSTPSTSAPDIGSFGRTNRAS
jgi:hypothetical protein